MKQVSEAYKNSMKSSLRNNSVVEVALLQIDTSAATDGAWSANGSTLWSSFDTIDYGYSYSESYATCELNLWTLDGTTLVAPSSTSYHDGFVSSLLSNSNGEFATPAKITRNFTTTHTLSGLTLNFDTRHNEWPQTVIVDFYLGTSKVATIREMVLGTELILNTAIDSCNKIVITFGNTLPYRRSRLQRVIYGVQKVFRNEDIISTKQSHDVDPLSRRLPRESMQFTLLDYEHNYDPDNPTGVYGYLDGKSPVNIRFGYTLPDGTVEWLRADRYILDSKPSASRNNATFSGTGLIGSLTGTYYKGTLGTKSFYDLAEQVLQDADLTPSEDGTNPWVIDTSLKQMYTSAVLPIDTHMNCLQLIAHACRCRLFTDDDNIIHISPFGVTRSGIYGGSWSDNGHLQYSTWLVIDTGSKTEYTYATLELNRWVLGDVSQRIFDPTSYRSSCFVSDIVSSENGTYSTNPIATKTFDTAHDLPIVSIEFDRALDEYPSNITVKYYAGDVLVDTKDVTVSSNVVTVKSELALNCTKLEISATQGLPYYRTRLSRVYYRDTDFNLTFDEIRQNSLSVSKIDKLKSVSVSKYAYTAAEKATTLFEESTTKTQLHVEFSNAAQDVSVTVTGGSLISSNIYAKAADLTLSSGAKAVTITGKVLSENSVVLEYPVASEGEIDREKNPLITSDVMATALAEHIKKYLLMQNTYQLSYRGNPELEVGDVIGLQTLYTNELDALVLVDEITFNGALQGKLKVKGLI